MSKLRFQVIPALISGSRLVSGGGVLTISFGIDEKLATSMLLSPSFNGIFNRNGQWS
jgi:hypothetical protein